MLVVKAAGTAAASVLQSLEAYKRTTEICCGRLRSLLKAVSHWEVVLQVPSGLLAPMLKPRWVGFYLGLVGLMGTLIMFFFCFSVSLTLSSPRLASLELFFTYLCSRLLRFVRTLLEL